MEGEGDFDLTALAAAIDAQRQARGLTWAGVARELCGGDAARHGSTTPVAASTIKGIGSRATAEGDGVLQLLVWLDRTPESFVPGHPLADDGECRLPDLAPGLLLRWDAASVFQALDQRRRERGIGWTVVAAEVGGGCTASGLTGLASAQRVAFPSIMRVLGWLGRPAAGFTRASLV